MSEPNAVQKVRRSGDNRLVWPQEFIEAASVRWAQGKSAGQIANALGVSKNVIIGVAHRNGFPARPSPTKRKAA